MSNPEKTVEPGTDQYEDAELQERYRRVVWLIRSHPMLSGLMEQEFENHLSFLTGSRRSFPLPQTFEEPQFEAELGYDPLWMEIRNGG